MNIYKVYGQGMLWIDSFFSESSNKRADEKHTLYFQVDGKMYI